MFPVHLMVRNIAAGVPNVEVELMLPAAGGCPHDHVVTPGEMRRVARADVLVAHGMGLEEFLSSRIAAANPRLRVIEAAGADRPAGADGGHGDHVHAADPHLFASPAKVAGMVRAIARELGRGDPRAAAYARNAGTYAVRMEQLAAGMKQSVGAFARTRVVVQHGAVGLLARDIGLEVVAGFQSHDGREPAASEVLDLVRRVRSRGGGAVLVDPQYPSRVALTVAREAGIPVVRVDPVASGPADAPPDYFETVMRANLNALAAALQKE